MVVRDEVETGAMVVSMIKVTEEVEAGLDMAGVMVVPGLMTVLTGMSVVGIVEKLALDPVLKLLDTCGVEAPAMVGVVVPFNIVPTEMPVVGEVRAVDIPGRGCTVRLPRCWLGVARPEALLEI